MEQFNVISSKKNHRGFGAGRLDLNSLSSVIIDGDQAYIDLGAIHAKSKVEKGIKFSVNREDVPQGRTCWIVWVAVGRNEHGSYYGGVTACEMLVDSENRKGWKILADHVNRMDYALKQRIMVDNLSASEKQVLAQLLESHNAEWWALSSDELKQALAE